VTRIVWLFSLVLGYSRLIWARFIIHQDLQSVLRCHIAALEAIGGVPREILYDRMRQVQTSATSRRWEWRCRPHRRK
jgi:transposase